MHTAVGLVDDIECDPPRQWLITNDCTLSLFQKLFGGSAARDRRENLLREICTAMHSAFSADQRFEHVVWYNSDTFDGPNDVPALHHEADASDRQPVY